MHAMTLMHIYVFSASINRMSIFQLKRVLCVKFLCIHFDSLCNIAFISHFYSAAVHIIQMFISFCATTCQSGVRLLLKIGC